MKSLILMWSSQLNLTRIMRLLSRCQKTMGQVGKLMVVGLLVTSNAIAQTQPLSLSQVLTLARQNALEARSYELNAAAARAEAQAVQARYDGQLTARWQTTTDKGDLNYLTSGEERRRREWSSHYKKFLQTGTSIDVGLEWQREEIIYPIPPSSLDPLNAPQYNPQHQAWFSVTVRQNLSRNRLAREIELLEDIAYAKGIEPQFMAKIKLQDLQTTCEKLYWQITALNEQIALSERLVATSQKFAKSMQERLRLGRADDVDVAEAESLVKTHESQRLDLEIQRDQLYQRLRIHVYGFSRQRVLRTPRQLPKTSRPLPAQSAAPALTLAVKRRYDLKMFAEQIKATSSQIELAQEQGAPDIGLFAAYRKRGIGGDLSESTEDMPDGTVTSVGIDVSWMIGQTESDSKAQAARIRQKSLNMQRQRLAEMVARNLHASFEAWRGAQRQRQLAENHIAILKNKRRAEQRKVNQARSDEVAVLRYEIEVLSARLKRVRAQLNVMIAGADIRGLLHTYPDEPKLATAR